ncbi:hypothetical protein [Streptomyces olivaceus]
MTVGVQVAAQRAEFLAALVRCGANKTLAEAQAGLSPGTVKNWQRDDPGFDAVVVAVGKWLDATSARYQRRAGPTRADEKRLREMWAAGAPVHEIAAELGVNRATIGKWRKKLGLPQRPQNELMFRSADQFRTLWKAGATYPEIRTVLGISDPTISKWRKELGLPSRAAK